MPEVDLKTNLLVFVPEEVLETLVEGFRHVAVLAFFITKLAHVFVSSIMGQVDLNSDLLTEGF